MTDKLQAATPVDELRRQLAEARAQQLATSEVLRVISETTNDVQPVLDAVVGSAARLTGAEGAAIFRAEDKVLRAVATYQPIKTRIGETHPIDSATLAARAFREARSIHVPDVRAEPTLSQHSPLTRLAVPIVTPTGTFGVILMGHREIQPFTDRQIGLIETFAAQAAIAIENVRLFNETKEALEQQTTTSDVLRAISRARDDVGPVLRTIVEGALRLCAADSAGFFRRDGDGVILEATAGEWPAPGAGGRELGSRRPIERQGLVAKAFKERRMFHAPDMAADEVRLLIAPDIAQGDWSTKWTTEGDNRSRLAVPVMHQEEAVGVIRVQRHAPGGFTERQIELVRSFAAQAGIAIENVRLFNETKESLERQTALSEILKAIAASPDDQQPVLDAIAESATRFCGAVDAAVLLVRDRQLWVEAHHGPIATLSDRPLQLAPTAVAGRAVLERRTVHISDVLGPEGDEFPQARERVVGTDQRALLAAPLLREKDAIGAIMLRKAEPVAFSPEQIQLVEAFAAQAAIAIENVRLFNETKEALEQQTATAQVLKTISRSAFDLRTVLAALVDNAARLTRADVAWMTSRLPGGQRLRAEFGLTSEEQEEVGRLLREMSEPPRSGVMNRIYSEGTTIHIADITADPEAHAASHVVRALRGRTVLAVPVRREDTVIAGVVLVRRDVRAFTDREVELVETFADQAAIAIENVRLFNETKESLEQQRAISDVLAAIASATSDAGPVFEVILRRAVELCDAEDAVLRRRDGEFGVVVAQHGYDGDWLGTRAPISRVTPGSRLVAMDLDVVHVPDVDKDPEFSTRNFPNKTALGIAVRIDGQLWGWMALTRREVRPFTDREIDLVRTFAAQAALAIENVRLFNETKEALAQQQAVSEVLQVISRAAFDLRHVLDTLADSAARLCEAEDVVINRVVDGQLEIVSHRGVVPVTTLGPRFPIEPGLVGGRAVLERRPIHVLDAMNAEDFPDAQAYARETGQRTCLAVPLLREGAAVGAILLRRLEVRPFTDRQIKLLETFADQAVIAIENVRLFNETKESLDRQTAVAGILRAISESPTDVQPVLDTIAESAARFCAAEDAAVILVDGDKLRTRAHYGPIALRTQLAIEFPLTRGTVTGRSIIDRETLQVPDLQAEPDDEFPIGKEQARRMGHRTTLASPLLREGVAVGAILLRRMEVRPFTEHQLELVRTFADQAVIAIENVRLFNETKEALDRQTAISEILRVMSSSPTDVQPVLDAIAKSAMRFCAAEHAIVNLIDGPMIHPVAGHRSVTHPFPLDRTTVTGRSMVDVHTYSIRDLADPTHATEFPLGHAQSLESGERAIVATPMVREDRSIGGIVLWRTEPREFTDKQIQLVETFARQAVIAIENVRLFNETKEALDRQTATAEILRLIAASPTDVQPVLEGIASSAARFCAAENVTVALVRDGQLRSVAAVGSLPGQRDRVWPADRASVSGRAVVDRRTVHVADLLAASDDEYPTGKAIAREFGHRTVLATPLLREGGAIGALLLRRDEVRPFTRQQIELVETFAAQAVIAIENVRLFKETKDALSRQTAVAETLGTISRSVFDLEAILTTVIQNAVRLCSAKGGLIFRRYGDDYRLEAMHGGHPKFIEYFKDRVLHPGRQAVTMRAVTVGEPVQIADVEADPEYEHTAVREFEPFRTVLGIPLLHQGGPIGAMSLWRNEVRPFSDAEIELVKTFADQASIAIENVRLFNETKEALERQTATSHVLEVISRSAFDLSPVLATVVERAATLADADHAIIVLSDEGGYEFAAYSGSSEVLRRLVGQRSPEFQVKPWTKAVIDEVHTIHIEDVAPIDTAPGPGRFSAPAHTRTRTLLGVPLVKDTRAVGALLVQRERVEKFAPTQVEMVETFAKQATIAIENARLLNEIQDKSRQLEVASRHKSEFLANMSHELRTPLNAIIGFTDVMLEEMFGPLNEKQKEYLDDVRSSGNHLLTLINDILDLSKIEAGRVELEVTDFSFPDALENALTLVRERAARHGITIAPEVAPDVGRITADERKVKQILVNLLSNAVKFTPDGGWVGVTVRRADGQVQVAVRDTGIGVAPADQERIFEEFQQVGRDPDKAREGTGLGLTLAKRFVELHGGRIWVESEVGKGSTFTFAIPMRQTAADALTPA